MFGTLISYSINRELFSNLFYLYFTSFVSQTATWKRNLLRAVLVTITAGIAIALKNKFAYVSALTGSLGSSVLAYILPCIFHIILYKNTNSVAVVIKDIIIVVFGIVGGVVGVVITIQEMVKNSKVNWNLPFIIQAYKFRHQHFTGSQGNQNSSS